MSDEWPGQPAEADQWPGAPVPTAQPSAPVDVPPSFLHRIATGMMVGGAADASPEELRQKGFGDFDYPANVAAQFRAGLDRARQATSVLAGKPTGMVRAGAEWDQMMGGVQALGSPLTAAFQLAGGMVEKGTGGVLNSEAVQDALMLSDGAPARISRVRGGVEQVIGELPKDGDFKAAAKVLDAAPAEQNLRDLWQERGIHPAEAAHDAQTDSFLRGDLTRPNLEPPDRSGIVTPRGTPIPDGTPRSQLAMTGEAHIDKILQSEPTKQVIDSPVVDREHTVPYTAGGSVPLEDPTFFIDHRFPQSFTIDGVTFDPASPFAVHENVEQHTMDMLLKGGHEPPATGSVRLYRGEQDWGPYPNETYRPRAQFWTTDPERARGYGQPRFIDVPREELASNFSRDVKGDYQTGDADSGYHNRAAPYRGMAPEEAYRVAHFEFAEKAEGAWYAAHGIDQARAEAAYAPYMAEIQKAADGNPPPNLYKRPYPHDDPSAAQHEPIAEPKPTAAEIARAKAILDSQEAGGALTAGGADVTRDIPSLATEPPRPAGSLVVKGRQAIDKVLGPGQHLQELLDPMATGGDQQMVVAKDAMNAVRRIRFEHAQWDNEITRRFDLEQQQRMWDALDEESVLQQEGKTSDNMGLATLAQDERLFVEALMDPNKASWTHALDAEMVEGDGLPRYTPRMGINIGLGAEQGAGPRALNELGKNVFTRTAQMLHRKHLMAEDTEAAMKGLVEKRMTAAGAKPEDIAKTLENVKIVRSIRTLPLATAKLEEAVVWRNMINRIQEIGKAAGQETVMVGKKPQGWFTIEGHPAFTKWEPRMEEADTPTYRNAYEKTAGVPLENVKIPVRDQSGGIVFDPKPIYIHPDFRGPLSAILDENTNPVYGALMALKGKTMTAIMNSPLVHNEVVFGKALEAAGGNPITAVGLYFRGNRMIRANPQRAGELVERGLNWIGPRGSIQEISGEQEAINLQAGRGILAQTLGAVPDLFNADATVGDKVRRSIDKIGDFWHNTLLWDRVRDLQFGLADHLSDQLAAKGADRMTADRIATHFANMIVGSIPKEAMSQGARAFANLTLFSRSYTLGNLAVFKQVAVGMPAPIRAQIARDMGANAKLLFEKDPVTGEFNIRGDDAEGGPASPAQEAIAEQVKQWSKSAARSKAISTVALSVGLYYIGNALLQHAFNIFGKDSTVSQEMNGYARRYESLMADVKENPWELRHILGRLSPTYDNEPSKGDRIQIGNAADGSSIYARNLVGKFGEELTGWPSKPMDMLRSKLNPPLGAFLDVLTNDQGFGRKVYDINGSNIDTAINVAKHFVMKSLPENQIQGAMDLLHGEGDPTVNEYRAFGPTVGFTTSKGAPSAQKGEAYSIRDQFETRMNLAWPDIKRQVQRGDEQGAREAMKGLGAPNWLINARIRAAQNPNAPIHGKALQDINREATPEQQRRMENAR